jgi:arylsulfatase A-like enzyme
VTSDHGELLGRHGLVGHGNALYDDLLHVPLVIWYPPSVPAGTRIETPVSLRDLAATLVDLAGLRDTMLPGMTLRGAWETPGSWRPSPLFSTIQKGINVDSIEPISKGDMHSLYSDGVHYILNGDGTADLYDLAADPGELANLAADSGWRAMADSLDGVLRALADSTARTGGTR